jgi:hypothetical protein
MAITTNLSEMTPKCLKWVLGKVGNEHCDNCPVVFTCAYTEDDDRVFCNKCDAFVPYYYRVGGGFVVGHRCACGHTRPEMDKLSCRSSSDIVYTDAIETAERIRADAIDAANIAADIAKRDAAVARGRGL